MNTEYSPAEIQAYLVPLYNDRMGRNDIKLWLSPYAYPLSFTGLAQGTQQQGSISVAANADFCLLGVNHRAHIGAAQTVSTKTAPFIRMLVIDSGSNEQFTGSAVDLENYSSNDAKVQNLPYPRIVSGRSALTVQVSNWAPTAETYALDLLFSGVLVRVYN